LLALNFSAEANASVVASALWLQPSLVKMIMPSTSAVDALGQFNLPYGWDKATFGTLADPSTLLSALLGWLITAVATLFGAPFWFDSLQKITQLRGAGSS
jgi:hypothetical protein